MNEGINISKIKKELFMTGKFLTAYILILTVLFTFTPYVFANETFTRNLEVRGSRIASGQHGSLVIDNEGVLHFINRRWMDNVAAVESLHGVYFAITNEGELWAWGYNSAGQLGDGTRIDRSAPVKIMSNVIYVTTNGAKSAAVTADGRLWIWGFWGWSLNYPGLWLGFWDGNFNFSNTIRLHEGLREVQNHYRTLPHMIRELENTAITSVLLLRNSQTNWPDIERRASDIRTIMYRASPERIYALTREGNFLQLDYILYRYDYIRKNNPSFRFLDHRYSLEYLPTKFYITQLMDNIAYISADRVITRYGILTDLTGVTYAENVAFVSRDGTIILKNNNRLYRRPDVHIMSNVIYASSSGRMVITHDGYIWSIYDAQPVRLTHISAN